MPIFTTKELVLAKLPYGVPSVFKEQNSSITDDTALKTAWGSEIDKLIADNSEYIESRLNMSFKNITDDPKTPKVIEKIARYLTVSEATLFYSGNTKGDEEDEQEANYRKLAEDELEKIISGEINLNQYSTSNTLAVGGYQGRKNPYATSF